MGLGLMCFCVVGAIDNLISICRVEGIDVYV